jgi:hypothetical protein
VARRAGAERVRDGDALRVTIAGEETVVLLVGDGAVVRRARRGRHSRERERQRWLRVKAKGRTGDGTGRDALSRYRRVERPPSDRPTTHPAT